MGKNTKYAIIWGEKINSSTKFIWATKKCKEEYKTCHFMIDQPV